MCSDHDFVPHWAKEYLVASGVLQIKFDQTRSSSLGLMWTWAIEDLEVRSSISLMRESEKWISTIEKLSVEFWLQLSVLIYLNESMNESPRNRFDILQMKISLSQHHFSNSLLWRPRHFTYRVNPLSFSWFCFKFLVFLDIWRDIDNWRWAIILFE
jgi:hypothetical protein